MTCTAELKERWQSITAEMPAQAADKWWAKVHEQYSSSQRAYHNLDHLSKMFDHHGNCVHDLQSPKAVSFAIFFHDLMYNPKTSDNEEKSGELFKEFAEEAGLPLDSSLYEEVSELIILTKTHMTDEHVQAGAYGAEDKHYFLDIDMAVLGSEPEAYKLYAEQIRQEYDYLPIKDYNKLRAKVLKTFLQIPNIFVTKRFREEYETRARSNILQEIMTLEA